MMLRLILILVCAALSGLGLAENGNDFLEKVRANYEELNSLDVNMRYELYKGHASTVIEESYDAFYARQEDESYRKIGETELINNKDYSLQINHAEKVIVVSAPCKNELFDADVKTSLGFCQDVLVSSENDLHIITLLIKSKTDLPYSRIRVSVDKKYHITEMVFFYATQVDFSKNYGKKDMDFPKLVVKYNDLSKKWKDENGVLATEKYIRTENNTLSPAPEYADYTILNLTNTRTNE
jgi:hypothetical protein